jgi:hypothetical protein
VARFERSGLSQEAFAKSEKVKVGTFRSWLYRLREEARDGGAAPLAEGFVEVVTGRAAEAGCVVRVGEAELRFSSPPSATYLAELLRRLGS